MNNQFGTIGNIAVRVVKHSEDGFVFLEYYNKNSNNLLGIERVAIGDILCIEGESEEE